MLFRLMSGYGLPKQSFHLPLGYGQARTPRGALLSETARYILGNMIPSASSHSHQTFGREDDKAPTISELDRMSDVNLLIPIAKVSSSFTRGVVMITEGSSSEWLAPDTLLPWILPDRIPHTEPENTSSFHLYPVDTKATS